jgi:ERCC4-related helicase
VNPIQMDWYKLDLPKEYDTIKNQLEEILHGYLKQLHYMKFFLNTPIQRISKMDLISFGNKLRSYIDNPNLENERKSYYFSAISLQAASLSLMHAMELLTTQEIETFLNFLNKLEENPSRYAQKIVDDSRFKKIRGMTELYSNVNHSKMNKLRDIVLEELESNKDSKIIAFTQYRGTASKIVGNLQTLPGVRPIRFVGQSSNSEDTGLSQNEQAEIIDDFRFGKHNVLVATSIAEEGLDIPSVELVIFYEPIPSEIRYIQRKGRTGRKKFGKVKILITQETLDEAYFYASLKRTRQMKAIVSNLEKDLKLSLNRTPLKKPTKITITEKFTGIKKKIKPRKNKYIKPETANVDPNDFDVEIQDGKVKELTIKKSERPSQILKNFKPTKTKGLNNAVNWVMRRSTECDNGDGIDIDEFLKISTLEGFDPELILAAISKLITEGLLYQPDSLKISVVQ